MIQNIWCVGRNYADHAKELGNDLPTEPLFFLKAGSCITTGRELEIPNWATDVHHELEIAFEFGLDLKFSRVGLALDLTERRLQNQVKGKGQPWTLAKSFRGSCPLSELKPIPKGELALRLWINDELRQSGASSQMIFAPDILREFAVKHFPVQPGDLLLTGTPAGVGAIVPGDRLVAELSSAGESWLRVEWQRPADHPPSA